MFIDAHLPCVFVNDPKPSRYVMLPDDVPQLSTLPDLGPVLRKCLMHENWSENFISSLLHDCVPIPRPSLVASARIDVASACILLNVLLATLLGLYPTSTKRPPFPMRAVFFRRVHMLLTSAHDTIVAFASENRQLLTLALTEYVWSTLPVYFPVETEAMQESTKQAAAFFTNAGQHFDAFRQVTWNDPEAPWGTITREAVQHSERISRLFKTMSRARTLTKRKPVPATNCAEVAEAINKPYIVRYDTHRSHPLTLEDEYGIMGNTSPLTPPLHSLVSVHCLPDNITRIQQRAVERMAYECERKAYLRSTKHICLNCEYKGKISGIRLCTLTRTFLCQNKCQGVRQTHTATPRFCCAHTAALRFR